MRASRSVSSVAATAVRALHRWRVDRRIVIARSPCDGPVRRHRYAMRRLPRSRTPSLTVPRPILATIDLAALRHNLARARAAARGASCGRWSRRTRTGTGSRARCAPSRDADGFALLDLDEAGRAREAGWRKPILLLEGCFEAADLAAVLRARPDDRRSLRRAARDARAPSPGAPAVGLPEAQHRHEPPRLPAAARGPGATSGCADCTSVRELTLMTHFANADRPPARRAGPVAEQLAEFDGVDGRIGPSRAASPTRPRCSCVPRSRGDSVRPGIVALRRAPSDEQQPRLRSACAPAMTLTSRIIAVQTLERGRRVGYGGTLRRAATRCASASSPAATPTAIRATRRRHAGPGRRRRARRWRAASRWT